MSWQLVLGDIGLELGLAPVGERIELHLAVGRLDHRQAQAVAAMEALAAGDPGVEAAQGAVQRQHLADVAAGVDARAPQVRLGVLGRQIGIGRTQVAHIGQSEPSGQGLAVVQRLAKQHARVEEQHRDAPRDLRGQMQQHGRLRAERRDQGEARAEVVVRGAQHGQRMGLSQLGVQPGRQTLSGPRALVVGHQEALSSNATARASAARW